MSYKIILNLVLYALSFLLFNYVKRWELIPESNFIAALIAFITISAFYELKKTGTVMEKYPKIRRFDIKNTVNALPLGITFDGTFQYKLPQPEAFSLSLNNQLREVYLKKFPEVYNFLYESINLCTIEVSTSVIQRTNDIYNLEVLPENMLELFFNLRQINDLRRINCYLIQVNKKLKYGGIFVSKIETINLRYKRFLNNYPYYLARLFYFLDFLWRRISPKVPGFQKIYFALTRGNNRAISFAEGLGRLYYCGFEIINAKEIDDSVYFIAKKVRQPLNDPNPSYGPLFKMKRIGLNGKPIFVFKFRTMHPYAEYLQKFVYEKFSLQEGGKFNNDFRVTSWGKIFRKLWIDELPMVINIFKGEIKLVGVRPLSNHYLNLYSGKLRERRMNYKPGLIPPFYVDMPKTLCEIMNSEEKYLDLYDKHPVITDTTYLIKAAYNILIKRKRSN
jgi:lipopolysaccharide/colanic/teichoic acid biosynthesis glycosyltransferase